MAHERGLIEKGSVIKLTCDESKLLSKVKGSSEDTEEPDNKKESTTPIKLQLVKKGVLRDSYIDIDLSKKDNPFTPGSWGVRVTVPHKFIYLVTDTDRWVTRYLATKC